MLGKIWYAKIQLFILELSPMADRLFSPHMQTNPKLLFSLTSLSLTACKYSPLWFLKAKTKISTSLLKYTHIFTKWILQDNSNEIENTGIQLISLHFYVHNTGFIRIKCQPSFIQIIAEYLPSNMNFSSLFLFNWNAKMVGI